MTPEKTALLGLLQEILSEPQMTQSSPLGSLWDSLAIVQVQAALDDVGVIVTGQQLADCQTVADVMALGWPAC